MSTPLIRCYESNGAIGQWFIILDAIRMHLEKNPPSASCKSPLQSSPAFER